MPSAKGPADMLEVARLFYKDEWAKQDIAKKMGIDARTVTAVLKRARETGMVQILIRERAENSDLEDQLRKKFPHLKRVLTLPTLGPIKTPEQHAELVRRFGVLAAEYFEELMSQQRGPVHLAVSGGVSVLEAMNAIAEKPRPNLFIHVTALVGYGILHKTASHSIPAINAGILWAKSGRLPGNHLSYATVPPLPTDLNQLAEIPSIKAVLNEMEKVNVVFAGLGMVKPDKASPQFRNQLTMTALLQPKDRHNLARAKAEADFSYCLITRDGDPVMDPDSDSDPPKPLQYFLSGGHGTAQSGINFYKRLVASEKTVIAIAGPFKLPAIRAALKGELMNIWVTDEDTARQILTEGS
jgi:deoxyribonucleoside regulator